ncbi:hypothetical protein K431DRAFT_88620 [Polychaeton citri CBS 116435]|uniref:Uncharacterized protein n=1 Tax=Polychaeton citri CBS 116435 TaxID=1314669 RepID=A0A9P4Q939_9PEZI|nr:hypothetical protein K431DRAFT_88620 [Polychaeton citri CBS 116435]
MGVKLSEQDYRMGMICAFSLEKVAVESVLDLHYGILPREVGDHNFYSSGQISPHNVIIASLGEENCNIVSASSAANDIWCFFPHVMVWIVVSIAGAIPVKSHKRRTCTIKTLSLALQRANHQ